MLETLLLGLQAVWRALSYSLEFMVWNLFLAFIPLALSIWLFRSQFPPAPLWYLGLSLFILFLPNAPYILTDTVHLIQLLRRDLPLWLVICALVPQYTIFLLAGFEAYVISLMNLHHFWRQRPLHQYYLVMEWLVHFLCGIGIYLGRFGRFNSWDLFTHPFVLAKTILHLFFEPKALFLITFTALVIGVLSQVIKRANLGFRNYYLQRWAG